MKLEAAHETPTPQPETSMNDVFSPRNLMKALWHKQDAPAAPAAAEPQQGDPLLPAFCELREEVSLHPQGVLVDILRPGTLQDEEFRMLRARVRNLHEQKSFRSIGVVSATAGEGKTTVAIGLACTLAQDTGRKVLLLEADLRKPAVERYLGLTASPGLAEWLDSPSAPLSVRRLTPSLRLISAGLATLDHREKLESKRMAGMLAAARHRFDYVIVDCPPLMPVADAIVLQDLFDGFLLVVRARHAPKETVVKAVTNLKPGRIRGVVLNDQQEFLQSTSSYGYRYRAGRPESL